MIEFWEGFSNREKALVIWLLIFLLWGLLQKATWAFLYGLSKFIFSKSVLPVLILMFLYIYAIIFAFYKIGFWNNSLIKDTLLWFFGSATVMFFSLNKVAKEEQHFQNTVLENLKIVVIIHFIINLYVFDLFVEILLLPILTFIVLIGVVAESKKNLVAHKVIGVILGVVGVYILFFAFYNLLNNFEKFATINNLSSFLLPINLTFAFIPFIYLVAVYMTYEILFIRFNINDKFRNDKSFAKFIKYRTLRECHVNLNKLRKFSQEMAPLFMEVNDKNDALLAMQKFKDRYQCISK